MIDYRAIMKLSKERTWRKRTAIDNNGITYSLEHTYFPKWINLSGINIKK